MSDKRQNRQLRTWAKKPAVVHMFITYDAICNKGIMDAITTRSDNLVKASNLREYGISRFVYNHTHRKLKGYMKK